KYMKLVERIVWLTAVIVSLVLYFNARQELTHIESWVEDLNTELNLLDNTINTLLNADSLTVEGPSLEFDHISESDIRILKLRGLDNPVLDLKQDLMQKTDLIAFDGVLGGTMKIYQEEQIILLPGFYAMAVFEDGHIQGGMLL